jgi:hypothetical protein
LSINPKYEERSENLICRDKFLTLFVSFFFKFDYFKIEQPMKE